MSTVRVDVDWARLQRRLGGNVHKAQQILDTEVLKDTTPYVPRDTGVLAGSGPRSTTIGSGEVAWTEPYSAAQYYGYPAKSHDVHPLAVMRWFEAARAANKPKWIRVVKAAGGR